MNYIVIGNIFSLISSILMVYSGYVKKKKKIIFIQTIQIGFSVISNIVLGGITGTIINALNCFINILCYKDKLGITAKIIISFLAITLSLKFNNLGVLGIFPLISSIAYIWLMNIKDVTKFKILVIFTMVMWGVYDIVIKSYASAVFDIANIIANLISIYQIKRK